MTPANLSDHQPAFAGTHILVVDDLRPVLELMVTLLREAGLEPEMASDGRTALQLSRLVRWDLVVLDVDLPDINGLELYVRIRRMAGGGQLPVLFVTGRPDAAVGWRLVASRRAQLLGKPFTAAQFMTAVEQCLAAELT
jgi:CheY-like chemotaxis protein